MVAQLVLQVGELPVQGIGRVRDVELSPMLEFKQVEEVVPQAAICAAQWFVSVESPARLFIAASLVQQALPHGVPFIQHGGEVGLVTVNKPEYDVSQFFCRFKLGVLGELLRHNLNLMELAHLDGNVGEGLYHTLSSVTYNGLHTYPSTRYLGYPVQIRPHCLTFDILLQQNLLVQTVFEHHHAEPPPEVGRIHDHIRHW